ncbi:MAG: 16S rRNA (cytosine(1402)-N(4))-methyltransferase RsmH [Oscillospiraceae bacterium]|nr:16S rRNA (cytosine(1402)-N(4))-methyltransferase RsmH [Oscillospiraceae bacterium]
MTDMKFPHYSVMLSECINALAIKPEGIYVDGTLGLGGHSEQIAKRLTTGRLIAIDRDEHSIETARARLAPYGDKVSIVYGNFRETADVLQSLNIPAVDGILLDLGVSSPQLDEAERGFSYMADAPLDMRMDTGESLTAWLVVNRWPEEKLRRILFEFGEERYAPKIADAIVRARRTEPIATTLQLVDIIKSALPAAALREKQHPAKRSFQAIRIAVNDELGAISDFMQGADKLLNVGGRLAVISFHSLEDRIVKNAIRSKENGCTCPRDFPVCVCGFKQTLKSITSKPLTPSEAELEENPRSRSAKLRVAERV